jgi:hypothetical protein
MSSEKSNSIFNKLYANRIVIKRNSATIVNLSLLFSLIALLTAPWLVIGGSIAALALGYDFSIVRNAAGFKSDLNTVVQEAKDNINSMVDSVTEKDTAQQDATQA